MTSQLTARASLEKTMLTKNRNINAIQVQTAQHNTFQSEVTIQLSKFVGIQLSE